VATSEDFIPRIAACARLSPGESPNRKLTHCEEAATQLDNVVVEPCDVLLARFEYAEPEFISVTHGESEIAYRALQDSDR
jgi:hypothetical protein